MERSSRISEEQDRRGNAPEGWDWKKKREFKGTDSAGARSRIWGSGDKGRVWRAGRCTGPGMGKDWFPIRSSSFYMALQLDLSCSPMTHHPKKKRVDDPQHSPPQDNPQRPVQLQRRRVWRACESCRSVPPPLLSPPPPHPPPDARRSSATATSPLVLSVPRPTPSAIGSRPRTGPLLADSRFRSFASCLHAF